MVTETKQSRHIGVILPAFRRRLRRGTTRLGQVFAIVGSGLAILGILVLHALGLSLYVWAIGIALEILFRADIDFSYLLNLIGFPSIIIGPLLLLFSHLILKLGEWVDGLAQRLDQSSAPIVRKQ
jgi:hypothetical protein